MVVLGLIILVVAILVGVVLVMGTGSPDVAGQKVDISLLDTVTVSLNPLALVVAGMAVMFLAWLGLVLMRSALARKARLRRERKDLEREAQHRRAEDEAARVREREELDRQHERELHDQHLATETARERAAVAEEDARRGRPDGGLPPRA